VATTASRNVGPIVSSTHLVFEEAAELGELEFGLTIANNAFHRWMVHCMAATIQTLIAIEDIASYAEIVRGLTENTQRSYVQSVKGLAFCY
jgi:predicted MarR family transcription regulator